MNRLYRAIARSREIGSRLRAEQAVNAVRQIGQY